MKEDALKWNQKHLKDFMPTTPSDFLVEFAEILPKGRVLDIACGNGRNSKFLAKRGFECECVDISSVALNQLRNTEGVRVWCLDLDNYEISFESYEVILDFYFLDRRLFEGIKKGLKKGGVFLMETFIEDPKIHSNISGEKILKKGELQEEFCDFEVFAYQEKLIKKSNEDAKIMSFGARKIK